MKDKVLDWGTEKTCGIWRFFCLFVFWWFYTSFYFILFYLGYSSENLES